MLLSEDPGFWALVRDGGPFVVAFVVLVLGGTIFWRMVGKPSLDALLAISANFAKAADKLEHTANRLDVIATALEKPSA